MESTDVKYNPWSTDDSAAALRNALLLAEKTGHIFRREEFAEEGSAANRLDDMPSIKMIKMQRLISQNNQRLNEVNLEIQKRVLHHETKDIVDISVMERRAKEVKGLSDHLQMVVGNKEFLITRLQQPFVGDHIKLEAAFHRYASELFTLLAPILSDLNAHLNDLSWINSDNLHHGQLEMLVGELSGALANIQTQYQSVVNMAQCIHSMQSLNSSQHSLSTLRADTP